MSDEEMEWEYKTWYLGRILKKKRKSISECKLEKGEEGLFTLRNCLQSSIPALPQFCVNTDLSFQGKGRERFGEKERLGDLRTARGMYFSSTTLPDQQNVQKCRIGAL